MAKLLRAYKYSGRLDEDDIFHAPILPGAYAPPRRIAPIYVELPNGVKVPQYAPTIEMTSVKYNPQEDCDGYFNAAKFQHHNNCYNYACDIASNSFAQPGRMHCYQVGEPYHGQDVRKSAELDGLIYIGDKSLSSHDLINLAPKAMPGHFVALLVSDSDGANGWTGDYHWVRCDDQANCRSWSQKCGQDQVTNFDFSGAPIADPRRANWTVNFGRLIEDSDDDVVCDYTFYAYMYVPHGRTKII